jgi:hypothetical protein
MLPERRRDRYLSPAETRALMRALDLADEPWSAAAIALLTLTGRARTLRYAPLGRMSTSNGAC